MTEKEIRAAFRDPGTGRKIYTLDSIDSTNNYAKELAKSGAPTGTIVIAETQTAGRGRFSRTWLSQPGKNLTFSIILRPEISPERYGLVPLYAAVSVCKGIEVTTSLRPGIKWPNDILLEGKKTCGILVESQSRSEAASADAGSVILGIGLNVNQQSFSSEIKDTATSLASTGGREYDRAGLLWNIVAEIESNQILLAARSATELRSRWMARSAMMGTSISVRNGDEIIDGTASGLGEYGELIMKTSSGERRLFSGDVTILK